MITMLCNNPLLEFGYDSEICIFFISQKGDEPGILLFPLYLTFLRISQKVFGNFPGEDKRTPPLSLKNVQNYSILYKSEAEEWEFLIASLFC